MYCAQHGIVIFYLLNAHGQISWQGQCPRCDKTLSPSCAINNQKPGGGHRIGAAVAGGRVSTLGENVTVKLDGRGEWGYMGWFDFAFIELSSEFKIIGV